VVNVIQQPTKVVYADVASPDGTWRLASYRVSGFVNNPVTVEVSRVVGGVLTQKRLVYRAEFGDTPGVAWEDSRTVYINGRRIDIYDGAMIDDTAVP